MFGQGQAGHHRPLHARAHLIGQSLGLLGGELLGAVFPAQQKAGLGQVGQNQVCLAAQLTHAGQQILHAGVKTSVVSQHRVYHLQCAGPVGKGLAHQLLLSLAGQVAGIDAVELHAQLAVVVQRGLGVGSQRLHHRLAQAAGVGGKQGGGQKNGLVAHRGQHRCGNA